MITISCKIHAVTYSNEAILWFLPIRWIDMCQKKWRQEICVFVTSPLINSIFLENKLNLKQVNIQIECNSFLSLAYKFGAKLAFTMTYLIPDFKTINTSVNVMPNHQYMYVYEVMKMHGKLANHAPFSRSFLSAGCLWDWCTWASFGCHTKCRQLLENFLLISTV